MSRVSLFNIQCPRATEVSRVKKMHFEKRKRKDHGSGLWAYSCGERVERRSVLIGSRFDFQLTLQTGACIIQFFPIVYEFVSLCVFVSLRRGETAFGFCENRRSPNQHLNHPPQRKAAGRRKLSFSISTENLRQGMRSG